MHTHSSCLRAANRSRHGLVPLTVAWLILAPPLRATEAPLVPSLGFSSGVAGEETLLNWDSQPGVCYRIQKSMDLGGGDGSGGWLGRAMVEPTSSKASWLDPESTGFGETNMRPRDWGHGQSTGKVSYSDLSVMISLEKASARRGAPVPGLPGEVQLERCDLSLATPAGPPLEWISIRRLRAQHHHQSGRSRDLRHHHPPQS